MKKFAIIGGVSLAVVVTGVFLVLSNLDSIIQAAVEKYGSEIMDTKVSLKKVKVEPSSGVGGLYRFSVQNPKGFEADHAFELGEVKIDMIDPELGYVQGNIFVVGGHFDPEVTEDLVEPEPD